MKYIRSGILFRKIGISLGILFQKIGIRNGYVFEALMACPLPKSSQVHPRGFEEVFRLFFLWPFLALIGPPVKPTWEHPQAFSEDPKTLQYFRNQKLTFLVQILSDSTPPPPTLPPHGEALFQSRPAVVYILWKKELLLPFIACKSEASKIIK